MYNWSISSRVPMQCPPLSWMWVFVFWQSLKSEEDGLSWLMWSVRPDAGYTWVWATGQSEPVQKSIMSFTQIKLHHSSPLLTSIRKCPENVPLRNETFIMMMMRYDHHDDWVFRVLRTVRLVLCCDVIRGHVNLRSHMAISWEASGPAQTCRDQVQILTQLQ